MHAALARGAAAGPEALVEACGREVGGRIPPRLRGQVYAAILGVQLTGGEQLSEAIASGEATLSNKRVLRVDCDRTRQTVAAFQSDEGKARLARLLSFFCKCQATPYRQGLNEVVAPLLLLGADGEAECAAGKLTELSDSAVHRLLQGMVTTFLPAAYGADDDFVGLQCSLEYVRLLLVFHDPELARILQQHSVTPELFATPWLFTLLARGHSLPVVYSLWDSLVLHLATPRSAAAGAPPAAEPSAPGHAAAEAAAATAPAAGAGAAAEPPMPHSGVHVGPGLLHFLCVAMLVRRRKAIQDLVLESASAGAGAALARDIQAAELSVLVSRLSLASVEEAEQLSRLAIAMAAATPDSVRRHLLDVAYAVAPPAEAVLRELVVSVCVRVSATEALTRAAGAAEISAAASAQPGAVPGLAASGTSAGAAQPGSDSPPLLLVVDCRPMPEFAASHIRGSFHLDPSVLHNPAMLTDMAAAFEDLSAFHFAVLGSGTHAELADAETDRRAGGAGPPGAVDAAHVVLMFMLNRGFGHVCEVRGGFGAVEEAVRRTPALRKFLVQDASAGGAHGDGDGDETGGAPLYDDGSSDGSAGEDEGDGGDEGEGAEEDTQGTSPQQAEGGMGDGGGGGSGSGSGSGSATPVARRRRPAPSGAAPKSTRQESTAGRAMRLLRRLSKPRPSDEHSGPLRLSSEVQPTIPTAWADGQHRAGSGRIRRWLAGRAAPTEVFTTSASPDDPPSVSPSVDEAPAASSGPAQAAQPRGASVDSAAPASSGLFAGLKVMGGAAAPGGDASEALGPREPAFFGLRAVRVEDGRPDGPGWAAADAEGEVFLGAAKATGALLRVVGCRRVFADERVERRVAIFTRRWACFLRVRVGDGPVAAGPEEGRGAPAAASLFSSLAAQATQAAARAAGLAPAVRLEVDELLPSQSVSKLKGKKGLANLAIIDFAEPSHDAAGAPASKRIVLLCDELRELVEALRSARK
ncbi:hypothetical protein FNF29_01189 [Cafeteria roenbergensis]|uniref:TBC1 domain family member 23 n=1 Tax=Cafeteria roenbergensis TaxID=33653 RepID=A0A5A8CVD7_CAFRO|nr:hypothetical protein FNF29_01189 [Cafeteria roenbergensis]|eukprot:KAA0156397.1 hypothetical protein FNF29_01189 [Cafeteria roenbergensis]